jgi:malonyl-CoA O-methyltransferase
MQRKVGKAFLQQLTQNYEQFRAQGKLPATFEVIYGHAWTKENTPISMRPTEQKFAPITFKPRTKTSL